ncbi:hypothetical protein NW759_016477 [Fusarium solani]|nr:hypothetical protein NW759_016477 [Fusarium solani]
MSSSPYSAYQGEIFVNAGYKNVLLTVTTDPAKLEEQAKEHMSSRSYRFVAGAAGERATLEANRLAFRQWRLIPRYMRDVSVRDLSVNLFGVKCPTPLLFAPIGVQKVHHPDGEAGMASLARELDVPYIMSTAATSSIEDVAEANGDGRRWFQLYWPRTDAITISLLQRAKENGFSVLMVTLDTVSLGWRPWDLDVGFSPFLKGVGSQVGLSDPVFQEVFKRKNGGRTVEQDPDAAAHEWSADALSGKAHVWEDLELLKKHWDGPIVLKGIQHVEDAKLAVAAGVDGIVVSNHGGRQMDGAIGALEVLPAIAKAVGDKLTILFDSGVRTGADVVKALSLGAKAVLLARPWIYGFGIAGKEGAREVVKGLLAELDLTMCVGGIKSLAECSEDNLRKIVYGGDLSSVR